MKTRSHTIRVNDIEVQVARKDIKNLNLAVYPPDGRVRVSVPLHVTDEDVRRAVRDKLGWIQKKRAYIRAQPGRSKWEMVSGESHFVWGKHCRLEVVERWGKHEAAITDNSRLILYVNPGASAASRERALDEWRRSEIKERLPDLIARWESILGVQVSEWGIKKMKTRWGSCNIKARRVWVNLELAKKPPECLEYVLVHEMVHLLERNHNAKFRAHMDQFMPGWRSLRAALNRTPIGHEG